MGLRVGTMFTWFVLSLSGCSDSSKHSNLALRTNSAASRHYPEDVILNLGTVTDYSVTGSFVWPGSQRQRVVAVERGCGCTATTLDVGNVVNSNDVIRVSIDLQGKPSGPGEQRLKYKFEDGPPLHLILQYIFLPPPFATPSSLVLRDAARTASVTVTFPLEIPELEPVIDCPDYLKHRVVDRSDMSAQLEFTVEDIDDVVGASGVISIKSSGVASVIRLPFIVLRN